MKQSPTENTFIYSPSVWLLPLLGVLSFWLVFGLQDLLNLPLNAWGIEPRTVVGLRGVLISPWLHADFNHLINNSVPFFILTMALVYFYREVALKVLVYGIFFSGLLTWVIGRTGNHIGASGLIYVLFSFIFFKGLMSSYYRLTALSMTTILVYGGMIWYVFPQQDPTLSWEGHLSGLITGLGQAMYFKTNNYTVATQFDWQKPDFDPQADPFMKHFDEDGNFAPIVPEEVVAEEVTTQAAAPPLQYHYVFIPHPKTVQSSDAQAGNTQS
jgi:membrane associated rhomboid family serine protease